MMDSSFQRITQDILDLCELQLQLLSVDSQAAKRKLTRAIACSAAALTLGGSALTVILGGAGLLLGELTSLSPAGALLAVGAVMVMVIVCLLVIALFAIKSAAAAMSESKSEFVENLRWLKATLVRPDSSARNQLRSESFPEHGFDELEPMPPRSEFHPRPVSTLYRR